MPTPAPGNLQPSIPNESAYIIDPADCQVINIQPQYGLPKSNFYRHDFNLLPAVPL